MKVVPPILAIVFFALVISPAVFGQSVDIIIPNTEGAAGDTVLILVNVGDVTSLGVVAFEMTVQYDSRILTAINATTSGTIAASWSIVSNTTVPGQISVSMAGMDALSGSGVLVNIEFLVNAGAPRDTMSQLHFTKARLNEGIPDSVAQDGVFTVGDSSVPPRLEGDVNGDNRVDHRDLLKLVLMYNKTSGDSGYDSWADFDADGDIDESDMIVVWRNFGAER